MAGCEITANLSLLVAGVKNIAAIQMCLLKTLRLKQVSHKAGVGLLAHSGPSLQEACDAPVGGCHTITY